MKPNTSTDLQTPANELTAKEQLDAGHGGSYSLDPKTGTVTLVERTQDAVVDNKHPDAPQWQPAADAAPDQVAAPADSTGFAG